MHRTQNKHLNFYLSESNWKASCSWPLQHLFVDYENVIINWRILTVDLPRFLTSVPQFVSLSALGAATPDITHLYGDILLKLGDLGEVSSICVEYRLGSFVSVLCLSRRPPLSTSFRKWKQLVGAGRTIWWAARWVLSRFTLPFYLVAYQKYALC